MIVVKPCNCDLADPKCNHITKYDDGMSSIIIIDNAKDAYLYALNIIRYRWPEGEELIKSDLKWYLEYTHNIIEKTHSCWACVGRGWHHPGECCSVCKGKGNLSADELMRSKRSLPYNIC